MKNEFCTYLTIYRGNKLPPFYLGSGTLYRIQNENYFGSVASTTYKKVWKEELKNNPHLFDIKILRTFKTRSEAYLSEEKLQTLLNVVKNPLYINKGIAKEGHNRGDRSRPVIQLDLLGNYIGEYKSITSCSRIPGVLDFGNVGACVKGTTKTAYNFQWFYKENYNKDKDYSMSENIFQFNLEGDLVKIWGYIGKIKDQLGPIQISTPNTLCISRNHFWCRRGEQISKEDILNHFSKTKKATIIDGKVKTSIYLTENFLLFDGQNVRELNLKCIPEKEAKIYSIRHQNKRMIDGEIVLLTKDWEDDPEKCREEYLNIVERYKENIRLGNISREKTRDKLFKGKSIVKLDLDGNFIERFKNIREVVKIYGKITGNGVRNCLGGNFKQANGSQWFYEKDYLENSNIGKGKEYTQTFPYIIVQIDKESGTILKLWDTTVSIKKYFGSGDVNAVLRKKQSTSNGFKWNELSREKLGDLDCVGMNIGDLEFAILR